MIFPSPLTSYHSQLIARPPLTFVQAVSEKKLFVADYHDAFLPFVARINAQENSAQYATRAMFFLSSDGTLKVLALELVLPPKTPGGAKTSQVLTPPNPTTDSNTISANMSTEDYMWELAKAHVSNNDLTAHQVFSHLCVQILLHQIPPISLPCIFNGLPLGILTLQSSGPKPNYHAKVEITTWSSK